MQNPENSGFPRGTAMLLAAVLLAGVLPGCISLLGERFEPRASVEGAPDPAEILADLQLNDAALRGVRASGRFILELPGVDTIYSLPQSSVYFERPGAVHVTGRKYGKAVLRLVGQGEAFLLEAPTERTYLLRERGETIAWASGEATPADAAREALFPEVWGEVDAENLVVAAWDETESIATVELYADRRAQTPRRILRVLGRPWTIVEHHLLDDVGGEIAMTELGDYRERDGARFPARIDCRFPLEPARVRYDLRTVTINPEFEPLQFDVPLRQRELDLAGYSRVESYDAFANVN